MDMMKRFKVDGVAFGERELRLGGLAYLDSLARRGLPLLAANLRRVEGPKRTAVSPPYLVKEYEGVKVGIFGLIGAEAFSAGPQADPDLTIEDAFQTAADLVPAIRKKADVVVLMAHMPPADATTLISQVKGIDIAILGHGAGIQPKPVQQDETIVMRPGERGQNIGALRFVVSPDGKIIEFDGEVATLGEKYVAKFEVLQEIDSLKAVVERLRKEDAVARQAALDDQQAVDRFIGDQKCSRCHAGAAEIWKASAHARAFQTLADLQMDQAPECIRCHVTGYGQTAGYRPGKKDPDLLNVQCEACHGMGTKHDRENPQAVTEALCVTCHDTQNSPGFRYESAVRKIAH
jgi:hypothetical protein